MTIIDDSVVEGDESFPVMLNLITIGAGVILGDNDTTVITIADDEGQYINYFCHPYLLVAYRSHHIFSLFDDCQ